MHKWSALFLLTAELLWAQAPNTAGRLADLEFVGTQLPKLCLNFYSQVSPAAYAAAVAALRAQITNLTDAEFYVGLAKLAAMAGDDHTFVRLDDVAAVNAGFQIFPLRFDWMGDGLFVVQASAQYSRAIGAQVVQIGDMPIDEVMELMGTIYPHDNIQRVRAVATALRFQQMLQGLDIVPATPTTPFTFRDLAGNQFTLDVGISNDPLLTAPDSAQGPLPEYMQNTSQHYWFRYSSARRLIYFKYNSCNDDPAYPFASMAANLLSTLDTNPVDTLVIDLRGNFGGVITLISPLVDGLVARMGTLVQNPDFRIYVFIDKVTFSAASYDAEYFKAPASEYGPAVPPGFDPSKIVIVMGEPTSEAPGVSQTTSFTLPYSKLDGEYSSAYIPGLPFVTPDYDPGGSSVGPDIAVPLNSTDYFARHDPMLAAALARFPGAPPAPTGSAIAVNGASFRVEQGLAPGSLASVFGTFPAGVDGVLVNGEAGQVVAASTSQVNFVMPASASLGRATISVRSGGSEVANGQATITPTGPGIFVLQPSDPSQSGAVLNQDSSVNASSNPAAAGSILQIFATGYGPLDDSQQAPVQVFLGEQPANVLYSAPSAEYPGLWQINAQVPSGLTGQVSLYLNAGNIASNGVTVWVR